MQASNPELSTTCSRMRAALSRRPPRKGACARRSRSCPTGAGAYAAHGCGTLREEPGESAERRFGVQHGTHARRSISRPLIGYTPGTRAGAVPRCQEPARGASRRQARGDGAGSAGYPVRIRCRILRSKATSPAPDEELDTHVNAVSPAISDAKGIRRIAGRESLEERDGDKAQKPSRPSPRRSHGNG